MTKVDLDSIVAANIVLSFTEMRAIIQALAHCDHTQINVSDATKDRIIKNLKWIIASEVINLDLNSIEEDEKNE